MTGVQHPPCPCPGCGAELDASSGLSAHIPEPEDRTICLYCGLWLVFTDDLTLRAATEAEAIEVSMSPEGMMAEAIVRAAQSE